jgi:putative membrane protein
MFHNVLWNTRMVGPRMGMRFHGGHPWMMGLICFTIFVALVLSIIAIVKVAKRSKRSSNALSILDERYAKGEISKEDYEQVKRDLK